MKNAPDTSFGDVSGITNTSDSPGERCLTCHESGPMLHWQGSLHDAAAVSCNACHSAHKPERDPQSNCLSCHENVKASLHLPSRHPVLENKIGCTDCHRPHGSINDSLLPGTLKTDVCIDCHQELRGPMLFEHEPVTEDCGLCHAPHGSVISDLLISRPPFLCQQCHMAADHSSQLSDGNSLLPGTVNLSAGSCLNCHSKVHGSNHPSGARLTR
jgi:DmsE family decaheme c-type cytochrome